MGNCQNTCNDGAGDSNAKIHVKFITIIAYLIESQRYSITQETKAEKWFKETSKQIKTQKKNYKPSK